MQNLAENKYASKVGEASGEADLKTYDAAVSASDNIEKLNGLVKHLKTSDAITGLGAEVMLNAKRVQTLLTNDYKAGKTVADTQVLDAMLGQDVFPMIQSLGIGARGLDTPAEREYLRKVMTGTVEMDKQALIKMTGIRRDIAKRAVERWNERVDSGELDRYFQASIGPKKKLPIPKIDSDLTSDKIGGGGCDTNGNAVAWNPATGGLDPGDVFVLLGTTSTDANGDYSFSNVPDDVVVVLSVSDTQSLRLTTTNATSSVEDGGVLKRQLWDGTSTYEGNTVTVFARQALSLAGDADDDVVDLDFAFDATLGGAIADDFGDLPESGTPDYDATLLASGGASHRIGGLYLAGAVSAETDGQPTEPTPTQA